MEQKGLCVLSDARPPWQKNLLRSFKARPCMVIIAHSFEDTNDKDTVRNVSNEFDSFLLFIDSCLDSDKKAKSTLLTSIVSPKAGMAENTKSPSYNSI